MNNKNIIKKAKSIPKRGVFIIPSMFTTGNIFCGYYATISAINGNFDLGAKAIGVAILLDGLDGRIARLTNSTSEFGVQLDSLADAISFGLAPAILIWSWALKIHPILGWFASFLFLTCGVMRLARFNIQAKSLKHFVGLPIPAGAGVIAASIHFFSKYKITLLNSNYFPILAGILTICISLLMVSTFRYPSFKSVFLIKGNSYLTIIVISMLLVGIWFYSNELLMIIAWIYLFSGPTISFKRKFFIK